MCGSRTPFVLGSACVWGVWTAVRTLEAATLVVSTEAGSPSGAEAALEEEHGTDDAMT